VTEPPGGTTTLGAYYADPHVRLRIREYCGDTGNGAPTAVFIAALRGTESPFVTWDGASRHPAGGLDQLLSEGADLSRSMWDTESLLIHLDIDYQNTDFPGEAYHHPADVFFKLEPVYRAVRHVLRRFDLPLLPLMTGQGYHFTGRVPLDAAVIDRIADLAPAVPPWFASLANRRDASIPDGVAMTERQAKAYVGTGLLVEFLAHYVLRRARRRTRIPIVLNGTVVGAGLAGRECVSIDLSCFGDPMDARHIRVAFGAYQKHRFRPDIVGSRVANAVPSFIAVPRTSAPLASLLSAGRGPRHAARTARSTSARLPLVTRGIGTLAESYAHSRLARFHSAFHATRPRTAVERDELFRSLRLHTLPACVARPLIAPNDLLLQPACIQHLTRWFMVGGMPPRDIAAIVASRYDADFAWGSHWARLDPDTRAEFDVRVFAGLLATGLDHAVDFNCRSAQEKGMCPASGCDHDLRVEQHRLLEVIGS
jgi:hypothetical protein